MDIPEGQDKPDNLFEKDNIVEDINQNEIKEKKIEHKNFHNVNSPQLIQDILHLSSHSTQNAFEHQNNLIKSIYSFNDCISPIIDNDFNEGNLIFNPKIVFLKKRNKLNMMNFGQINLENNCLIEKIKQYNDLKQKISEYKLIKNNETKEKENNDNPEENIKDNKKELNLTLFLVNHPLINLFKEEIDIEQMKNYIQKEFLKRKKDNTSYKPGPPNPHLINILEQEISQNEENESDINISLESVSHHSHSSEALEAGEVELNDEHQEEDEHEILEIMENANNQIQVNENNNNNINNDDINIIDTNINIIPEQNKDLSYISKTKLKLTIKQSKNLPEGKEYIINSLGLLINDENKTKDGLTIFGDKNVIK